MIAGLGSWGRVLSGGRVRLEPIDSRLACAMLARCPRIGSRVGARFPTVPVVEIARTIAAATEPLGPFLPYVIVRELDGTAVGDAGFRGPPSAEGEVETGTRWFRLRAASGSPVRPSSS